MDKRPQYESEGSSEPQIMLSRARYKSPNHKRKANII